MQVDIQAKNLKYNQNGSIDMDLNHPVHGWIPFTASPYDIEPHGQAIYQACIEGQFGSITPYSGQ